MIFCGIYAEENIVVHPSNNPGESHFITIAMAKDDPHFTVTCCCDEDWEWKFWYTSKSDYERVKYCIMDAVASCDTMEELMDVLADDFEEYFDDMFVEEDEFECDGDCANCGFYED